MRIDEAGDYRTPTAIHHRVDVVPTTHLGRSRGADPRHKTVVDN